MQSKTSKKNISSSGTMGKKRVPKRLLWTIFILGAAVPFGIAVYLMIQVVSILLSVSNSQIKLSLVKPLLVAISLFLALVIIPFLIVNKFLKRFES